MTTAHNHDVTSLRFITQYGILLLFYKTEKSLPIRENNFPRCSQVAAVQKKKKKQVSGKKELMERINEVRVEKASGECTGSLMLLLWWMCGRAAVLCAHLLSVA